jgi:type IV pilus assembly protein PilC
VREGQALWESIDKTELISDIAVQMIKVGESTGALDEMLEMSSDFTDEEIDAKLSRIVSLIEPLMLVFMAIVVAVMLLSVYYPMIQAYGQSRL